MNQRLKLESWIFKWVQVVFKLFCAQDDFCRVTALSKLLNDVVCTKTSLPLLFIVEGGASWIWIRCRRLRQLVIVRSWTISGNLCVRPNLGMKIRLILVKGSYNSTNVTILWIRLILQLLSCQKMMKYNHYSRECSSDKTAFTASIRTWCVQNVASDGLASDMQLLTRLDITSSDEHVLVKICFPLSELQMYS